MSEDEGIVWALKPILGIMTLIHAIGWTSKEKEFLPVMLLWPLAMMSICVGFI